MTGYERTREIRHTVGPAGEVVVHSIAANVTVRAVAGDEARAILRYALRSPDDAAAQRIEDAFDSAVIRGPGRLEVSSVERAIAGDLPSAIANGTLGAVARALRLAWSASMELQIDVPAGTRVAVETVSGRVSATGLTATQRYRTVSGALRISDGQGDVWVDTTSGATMLESPGRIRLEWHAVSGDLRARAATVAGMRLDSLSGDAWVEAALVPDGEYRAKTVSGDLRLAPDGGLVAEVRTISGGVRSEMPHRLEGASGRRVLVVGDGGPRVRFESMSGGLAVVRPGVRPDTAPAEPPQAAVPPASEPPQASGPTGGAAAPEDQLAILRAVERGEIDVDEAMRRLGARSHA